MHRPRISDSQSWISFVCLENFSSVVSPEDIGTGEPLFCNFGFEVGGWSRWRGSSSMLADALDMGNKNISRIHSPRHILSQWVSYISQVGYIFSTTAPVEGSSVACGTFHARIGPCSVCVSNSIFWPMPSFMIVAIRRGLDGSGWMDGWLKGWEKSVGFHGVLLVYLWGRASIQIIFCSTTTGGMIHGAFFGAGPEISPENNGCAFRYYKKGLAPKNYGVETVEELAGLVSDTVVICPPRVQFSEDVVRAEGGGKEWKISLQRKELW